MQDVGLIDAVRKGKVEIVAAVESFDDGKMVLADGTRLSPDAVIAATGYVRGLEDLVGHLDVLDARGKPVVHGARSPKTAPGLYFTGFTNPISGNLRELALDAVRIARALASASAAEVNRPAGRVGAEATACNRGPTGSPAMTGSSMPSASHARQSTAISRIPFGPGLCRITVTMRRSASSACSAGHAAATSSAAVVVFTMVRLQPSSGPRAAGAGAPLPVLTTSAGSGGG